MITISKFGHKIQLNLLIFLILLHGTKTVDFVYHDYSSMTSILQDFAARYPTKTSLVQIGKTGAGITNQNCM